jgi:predicted dehydrogenase
MATIAHVGCGYWGKNLIRNFAELGVLTAVSDANPEAAGNAASVHGVRAASFEAVLADPAIDGVSIASPAELHFAHASAALESGKHVFVEKPLALDVGEAEQLRVLADKAGRVLMVGHLLQYHPAYLKLRDMVAAGELGRLNYVYSNRLSLGKFRREENVLWSFAPHDISMILGLFGAELQTVSAQGQVAYTPGVADLVTAQFRFADGGAAHIMASWMHPFKEQRLVVIGDKAMAVFEDSAPQWADKLKLYRHVIDCSGSVPNPVKAEPELVEVVRSEPLRNECQHFCDCIDQGRRPRTDGVEGLAVLRALAKAERALQESLTLQGTNQGERR